jgi:hypothetical protein
MPYGPSSGSHYISVFALYASDERSCGIREDGALECWDRDGGIMLTGAWETGEQQDMNLYPSFTTLAASSNLFCGLDEEGGLACWGRVCVGPNDSIGQEQFPGGYFNGGVPIAGAMTDIAVGQCQICGISAEQTIQCWPEQGVMLASGMSAALAPPEGQFTSLSMSQDGVHLCAVGLDKVISCWTDTGVATSPEGEFLSVSAGGDHGPLTFACGVRTDGSVDCWDNTNGKTDVPGGTFLQVSTADRSACGLHTNGIIECMDLDVGEIPSE